MLSVFLPACYFKNPGFYIEIDDEFMRYSTIGQFKKPFFLIAIRSAILLTNYVLYVIHLDDSGLSMPHSYNIIDKIKWICVKRLTVKKGVKLTKLRHVI